MKFNDDFEHTEWGGMIFVTQFDAEKEEDDGFWSKNKWEANNFERESGIRLAEWKRKKNNYKAHEFGLPVIRTGWPILRKNDASRIRLSGLQNRLAGWKAETWKP